MFVFIILWVRAEPSWMSFPASRLTSYFIVGSEKVWETFSANRQET